MVQKYSVGTLMNKTILDDYAKDTIPVADRKYVVGAEISSLDGQSVAWYNGQPYHAMPIALNLIDMVLTREATGFFFFKIKRENVKTGMKNVSYLYRRKAESF